MARADRDGMQVARVAETMVLASGKILVASVVFSVAVLFACGGDSIDPSRASADAPSAGPGASETLPPDAAHNDADPDAGGAVADAQDAGDAALAKTNPLAPPPTAVEVSSGNLFVEGPVWIAADGVLLFSDSRADRIQRLTPPATVTLLRTVDAPNGNALGPAAMVYTCEQGARRVVRAVPGRATTVVAERFDGKRFNRPNDVVVRSDGNVYFTDPNPQAVTDGPGAEGTYHVAPNGAISRVDAFAQPNGVALSPDGGTLYVGNLVQNEIRKYALGANGQAGPGARFVGTGDGPDGMGTDDDGNLYVAVRAGIEVFAPDGRRWGLVPIPGRATNVAFGGEGRKTLYVTAGTRLFRLAMPIAGRSD